MCETLQKEKIQRVGEGRKDRRKARRPRYVLLKTEAEILA